LCVTIKLYCLFVEEPFVDAIERLIQVPYSSPITIRFIVAVNSNGSSSVLTDLTNYSIERVVSGTTVETFNSSHIEIISNYTFQLVIPRTEIMHTGRYLFLAGNDWHRIDC